MDSRTSRAEVPISIASAGWVKANGGGSDDPSVTRYRRSNTGLGLLYGPMFLVVAAAAPFLWRQGDTTPMDGPTVVFISMWMSLALACGVSFIAMGAFAGITVREGTVSVTPMIVRRTVERQSVRGVEVWRGPGRIRRAGIRTSGRIIQAWPWLSGHRHRLGSSTCGLCLDDLMTMRRLADQLGVPFEDRT